MSNKQKQKIKLIPIKNGKGEIKGFLKGYWSQALKSYVTIPGAN